MFNFLGRIKESFKYRKKYRKEEKRKRREEIKYLKFKDEWRKNNKHNKIIPENMFPIEIVKVGKHSYGSIKVFSWDMEKERLVIGNYVSIASGVKFILGGNHEVETFTTYPFKVMCFNENVEAWTKGPIVIKDDVWIGTDSTVLSGVTIEQGSIIAAGSVVTKNVPAYSIVGGNPAKIIKYRYPKEIIKEMIKIDWSAIELSKIEKIKKNLYKKLNLEILQEINKELENKN